VISENNANTFINRLDRFWANEDLIVYYESTLTGTGNRIFIDNDSSDTIKFNFIISLLYLMGLQASAFIRFVTTLLCFALLCCLGLTTGSGVMQQIRFDDRRKLLIRSNVYLFTVAPLRFYLLYCKHTH